jgi:hypothetical protein
LTTGGHLPENSREKNNYYGLTTGAALFHARRMTLEVVTLSPVLKDCKRRKRVIRRNESR